MLYRFTLFIGLFLHLSAHGEMSGVSGAPLFLEVGEQRTLTYPGLVRYSVSGSGILKYLRVNGENSLLIKALKPGLATLYVLTAPNHAETHLVRISGARKHTYPDSLFQALNLVKTSEVIDAGDHYLIRGKINDPEEARALANLKMHFAEFIVDETSRPESAIDQTARRLKPILDRHPGLTLEVNPGNLTLHGGVSSTASHESLLKEVRAIDPLVGIDVQCFKDSNPTLYFKVYLLEVKKDLLTSLGIEWPLYQPFSLNLDGASLFSSDSIDLKLHALSQQGLVKILSTPELVVKAPGQAELFAGGELPIRERSRFSDNITWKNVGLSLKLDVKEFGGEQVRLAVETEMSHLDGQLTNDNIPGIQTNRMKTLVEGTFGKPLLLAGLLQDELRTSSSGIPGLKQIPVLGKLFSSDDYQNSRSEFVTILLPERRLPQNPMVRVSSEYPRGYLPVPRNYVGADEKELLKTAANYPWNAL